MAARTSELRQIWTNLQNYFTVKFLSKFCTQLKILRLTLSMFPYYLVKIENLAYNC